MCRLKLRPASTSASKIRLKMTEELFTASQIKQIQELLLSEFEKADAEKDEHLTWEQFKQAMGVLMPGDTINKPTICN